MVSELAVPKNTVKPDALHLFGVDLVRFFSRYATIWRTLPAASPRSYRCYSAHIADALFCLNDGKEIGAARQQAPDNARIPNHHEGKFCVQSIPQ